ncbi:MAG: ZIP family metal transporter [Acidimicrobiia bacterium]
MITISLLELLPAALEQAQFVTTALCALAGAAALALMHWVIPHTHLVDEARGVNGGSLRVAYLVAFGLILHDFPEGFAMANAYVSTPRLGVMVAVAIVLHNVPEEFVMALPAVLAGRRRFLSRAALVSAAAEPAGALIGLAGISAFPGLNAGFLAFAAGAMVFVSLHELVPMARQLGHHRATEIGAAAGAAMFATLGLLVGA